MTQDDIDRRIQVENLLIAKAKEDRNQILSGQLRSEDLLKYLETLVSDYGTEHGFGLTYRYLYALCGLKHGDSNSLQEVPKGDAYYGPTEFSAIISIIKMLKLTKDDVFYDLGSGRGIFINLIGLITKCQVRGIEVDTARAADSRKLSKEFGLLQSVQTIHSNVLDVDISDGTVFYMYDSFGPSTTQAMLDRIVLNGEVRVVTFREHTLLDKSDAFEEICSEEILCTSPVSRAILHKIKVFQVNKRGSSLKWKN